LSSLAEVQRMFNKLAKSKLKQEHFHAFASIVREERAKGFERGEGPDGEKWTPLKPATIARKAGLHKTTRVQRNKQGISGLGKSKTSKKSKSPSSPLIDMGVLMAPTVYAGKDYGQVRLPRSRGESVWSGRSISDIHDKGAGKIPRRHHWAIYKNARTRIRKEFKRLVAGEWQRIMRGA